MQFTVTLWKFRSGHMRSPLVVLDLIRISAERITARIQYTKSIKNQVSWQSCWRSQRQILQLAGIAKTCNRRDQNHLKFSLKLQSTIKSHWCTFQYYIAMWGHLYGNIWYLLIAHVSISQKNSTVSNTSTPLCKLWYQHFSTLHYLCYIFPEDRVATKAGSSSRGYHKATFI